MSEDTGFQVRRRQKEWFWIHNKLIDERMLKGASLLVYLILCRYAEEDTQECFPSIKHIAELTGLKRNTVVKATDNLIKRGFIHKKQGGGRKNPNRYTVLDKGFNKDTVSDKGFNSGPETVQNPLKKGSLEIQDKDLIKKTKEKDMSFEDGEKIREDLRRRYRKAPDSPPTTVYSNE